MLWRMDARKADADAQTDGSSGWFVHQHPDPGLERTHQVWVLSVCALVSVSGTREQRIASVANLQRGRISRAQLLAAGISHGTVARMIARGELHREHPGVYAVGHLADMPLAREAAALLSCGEDAVLGYRSAAYPWGLLAQPAVPVEVIARHRQTRSRRGVTVHRSRTLLPRDATIRNGLPVTSCARTLLDLAAVMSPRQLEKAVDSALLNHLVTLAQLQDVLDRSIGRRGAHTLKRIAEREGPAAPTHEGAEERFLAVVRQSGLPQPEVNARIHGYEVDFLWRAQRVALEIDSWDFHRTRNAFERDRLKGARLSAGGLNVVRATGRQINDEPVAVVVRIAQTLANAA
jgi:very-short-patch-repair endonuclease